MCYLELRNLHSKSYIRKHKSANIIDLVNSMAMPLFLKKGENNNAFYKNCAHIFAGSKPCFLR